MNISRDKLREAIVAAIERKREAHIKKCAVQAAEAENAEKEWLSKNEHRWREFLRTATNLLDSGYAITSDIVPKQDYGQVASFNPPHVGNPLAYQPSSDLTYLLSVLDAITDDTVSFASLGIKDLKKVFGNA